MKIQPMKTITILALAALAQLQPLTAAPKKQDSGDLPAPTTPSTEQKGATSKGGPSHSNLRLKGGSPAPATVTTSFSQQADGTAQITASAPVQLTDAQLPAALDEAAANLAHSIGATPKNGTGNPRTLALSGKVQGTSVALDATLNYNSGKLTWSIKLSKLPGQLTIAAAEGMIAGKALTVQPWGAVKATGTAPAN